MKKLAIFTEGQTEQLLSEQTVIYTAGEKQFAITKHSAHGGRNKPRIIEIGAESDCIEYFILIVDCGTDGRVKSDIIERHSTLASAGYEKVIGIRDAYPTVKYNELHRLRNGLKQGLPDGAPSISFILGVMEIEAWILAEYTHFQKFHPNLNIERIKNELGLDIIRENLSQRENPAKDLKDIYWLEAIHYDKSRTLISKILDAIDQQHLRDEVSKKFDDLLALYQELELFFSN
jgi:hypothetical protein